MLPMESRPIGMKVEGKSKMSGVTFYRRGTVVAHGTGRRTGTVQVAWTSISFDLRVTWKIIPEPTNSWRNPELLTPLES